MVKFPNNNTKSTNFNYCWTMILFSVLKKLHSLRRESVFHVENMSILTWIELVVDYVQMEQFLMCCYINVREKLRLNAVGIKYTTWILKSASVLLVYHISMEEHALVVSFLSTGTQIDWNASLARKEVTILCLTRLVCNAQVKVTLYLVCLDVMMSALFQNPTLMGQCVYHAPKYLTLKQSDAKSVLMTWFLINREVFVLG